MARSSGRSRPAPARSAAPPASRGYSTAAPTAPQQAYGARPHAPAAPAAAPAAAPSAGGGLFANMASTAAGVAVGSTVGHGLSNMLFGGSSSAAEVPAPVAAQAAYQIQDQGAVCAIQAKDFTKCLDATGSDMQSCSYYFEALKACQQAAAPY
ncbi:Uncharacterized conserved protein [Phaffia rhodozyma]|uniref:Uncharacterized conserved protein n=1 Tax=Phaffia rhodozyma TaxID=264483 RepID=A0A0F7SLB9_PHARH|nr:Uncharacterized conserved protein [Phaffia rhodozyma]